MSRLRTSSVVFAIAATLTALPASAAFGEENPYASCWGQASRVFAATGDMGAHASQMPTPRLGLRNLARAVYEAGLTDDDSMAALGVFVATELGYSIDACQ